MSLVYFPIFLLAWAGAIVGALLWSPFAIVLGAFEASWNGAGELA